VNPRRLTQIARTLRKRDTWAEKLLWQMIRDRRFSAYKFRRQHIFGEHILDFFCIEARLNIELDGSGHGHPEHQTRDMARDAELEAKGIRVLRFWNSRLRREKQSIRDTIWQVLQERAAHPLPDYCRPMKPTTAGNKGTGDEAQGNGDAC
jgi:very-short-patch-repair endonuclease